MKKNDLKEKLFSAIPLVICISIILLAATVCLRIFDSEDAADALGEVRDFSEGWVVTYADGTTEENVTLPLEVDGDKGEILMMANTIDREYDGLSLSTHIDNAAMRIYVDEKEVFSNGFDTKSGIWKDDGAFEPKENQAEGEAIAEAVEVSYADEDSDDPTEDNGWDALEDSTSEEDVDESGDEEMAQDADDSGDSSLGEDVDVSEDGDIGGGLDDPGDAESSGDAGNQDSNTGDGSGDSGNQGGNTNGGSGDTGNQGGNADGGSGDTGNQGGNTDGGSGDTGNQDGNTDGGSGDTGNPGDGSGEPDDPGSGDFSGGEGETPPEKPSDDGTTDQPGSGETPPEKPSDENGTSADPANNDGTSTDPANNGGTNTNPTNNGTGTDSSSNSGTNANPTNSGGSNSKPTKPTNNTNTSGTNTTNTNTNNSSTSGANTTNTNKNNRNRPTNPGKKPGVDTSGSSNSNSGSTNTGSTGTNGTDGTNTASDQTDAGTANIGTGQAEAETAGTTNGQTDAGTGGTTGNPGSSAAGNTGAGSAIDPSTGNGGAVSVGGESGSASSGGSQNTGGGSSAAPSPGQAAAVTSSNTESANKSKEDRSSTSSSENNTSKQNDSSSSETGKSSTAATGARDSALSGRPGGGSRDSATGSSSITSDFNTQTGWDRNNTSGGDGRESTTSYINADIRTKTIQAKDTTAGDSTDAGEVSSNTKAAEQTASGAGTDTGARLSASQPLKTEAQRKEAVLDSLKQIQTIADKRAEEKPKEKAPGVKDAKAPGPNVVSAGDILFDLSYSPEKDNVIVMYFERAKPNQSVVIGAISVMQRDSVIIGEMRESVYPIFCCIILLICAAVFVVFDVARRIAGERMRGMEYLAFLAVDTMLYAFFSTGVASLFLNNQLFFSVAEAACYATIPLFLAVFIHRGFAKHAPIRTRLMMVGSTIYVSVILGLDFLGIIRMSDVSDITFGVQSIVFLITLSVLWELRKKQRSYRKIWMDVLGYLLIWGSMSVERLADVTTAGMVIGSTELTFAVAGFLLLVMQHTDILLYNYRKKANAAADRLAEEKERADEARAEAEAANEAKGSFLANMSHEIRTPINAVLGMDEMILRETGEKNTKSYAMDIFTAGQTLLSLINDILDFSKIESGKMEIVPVDYELSSMINDLYNMAKARVKGKDLEIIVEVDETIPTWYHGDDVRLRQVVTNILTNAVKYTPEGKVTLSVKGERQDGDCLLTFSVQDTGIGIKEEDIPKLYEAYQRIEEGRNRNIEGTGLGMNITVQLLSLMGSKMEVSSVYGEGSRFWFTVRQPIVDDTPIGDLQQRIAQRTESYAYETSFITKDAKVLVVDDNAMNRKVFSGLLSPTKVDVTEAEGGQEAVDLCHGTRFDIIFMDHMMPGMDGIEAMHRIKDDAKGACAGVPIYILTANAVAGARENYLAEGFDGFLSKPIVSVKLEEAVRSALPEEKILTGDQIPEDVVPAGGGEESTQGSTDRELTVEDLPMVDGLDWYIAQLHLPGMSLIEASIKEFYTILATQAGRLSDAFDRIGTDGFDAYRIQVHGMKSAAATVGIIPLAGMAKILEFAAKDEDYKKIQALHWAFMEEWNSYGYKLRGVFGIGEDEDDSDKPLANPEMVLAYVEMIQGAMEDFDTDRADELVAELKKYRYEEDLKEQIHALEAAVADLDDMLVAEIAQEMIQTVGAA